MSQAPSSPRPHRYSLQVTLVSDLREVLGVLEDVHDSIALLDALLSAEQYYGRNEAWWSRWLWFRLPPFEYEGAVWQREASLSLLPHERLTVVSLQMSSPGWLEVAGSLNPLETIRRYLEDREIRRQNRDFRDRIEEERGDAETAYLRLQGESMQNEILRERIEILNQLGVPQVEQARLLNISLLKPLDRLADVVDRGQLALPDDGEDPEDD